MLIHNIFSDKLLLMIASSYEKLRKLFPLLRATKRHFFGIQDQKVVIRSYLKCTKDCLKISWSNVFFTRKLGIAVSIIAKYWIFSKWKDIIYEDVKKQGSKYETLQEAWCNFSANTKTVSILTSLFSVCVVICHKFER